MTAFTIESRDGILYGTYEASSKREAFMQMLSESGDEASYGDEHVGTESDWIITESTVHEKVASYPGCAVQVWGGWIWRDGSHEQSWSKRPTRHECERVVHEAVQRLGIEEAFE